MPKYTIRPTMVVAFKPVTVVAKDEYEAQDIVELLAERGKLVQDEGPGCDLNMEDIEEVKSPKAKA